VSNLGAICWDWDAKDNDSPKLESPRIG